MLSTSAPRRPSNSDWSWILTRGSRAQCFEGVPGATPDDPTGPLAPLAAWRKRTNEVG